MSARTPGPFRIVEPVDDPSNYRSIRAGKTPNQEFDIHGYCGHANAEFIVQACNSHDSILSALKRAVELFRYIAEEDDEDYAKEWLEQAQAAIRAAQECG